MNQRLQLFVRSSIGAFLSTWSVTLAISVNAVGQCLNWDTGFQTTAADVYQSLQPLFSSTDGWLYASRNWSRLSPVAVVRWNGSIWETAGPQSGPGSMQPGGGSFDSSTYVRSFGLLTDGSGTWLYAGGWMLHGIARFDGQVWSHPWPGLQGIGTQPYGNQPLVIAIRQCPELPGQPIYLAGTFLGTSIVSSSGVIQRTSTGWASLGGGVSLANNAPAVVEALEVYDDGTGSALYAGGSFQRAGNLPINYIAKSTS